MLRYEFANEKTTPQSKLALVVHHPLLGSALKREMDKLGIECVVQYRTAQGNKTIQHPPEAGQPLVGTVDFIRKHFEAGRAAAQSVKR
jgi:hypothetical protein